MRLYHGTTHVVAEMIERDGFRDAEGMIGGLTLRGVWLADRPLDVNDHSRNTDWMLAVDVSDEQMADLAHYEVVEDGKPYREFCVPAAIVNAIPIALSCDEDDEQLDEARAARWSEEV